MIVEHVGILYIKIIIYFIYNKDYIGGVERPTFITSNNKLVLSN